MKVAAIDMGTNTFLCLVLEKKQAGLTVKKNLYRVVRLGEGVAQNKKFSQAALERTRDCLTWFKNEIDEIGVDKVLAVATAAARDVENSREIFDICHQLGIPLEIIDGEREAELTYLGACFDDMSPKRKLVVDIGGGSTELIIGEADKLHQRCSLRIGGVRLKDICKVDSPATAEQVELIETTIEQTLELAQNIWNTPVDYVIAVSGTPTSLAAAELGGFDEEKVQGHKLSLDSLQKWKKNLEELTIDEIKEKYHVGGSADILYAGTSILLSILKRAKKSELIVSTKGVRYGVALHLLT